MQPNSAQSVITSSGKFNIKLKPLVESIQAVTAISSISKKAATLFRPGFIFTNRIEELSQFCLINKKIINKLIKQKPQLFAEALEQFVKYMPNLLDFDNKRGYFKKELAKLKRNHHHQDVNLMIRRDNIFMDAYA